jgi:hypothetical protein
MQPVGIKGMPSKKDDNPPHADNDMELESAQLKSESSVNHRGDRRDQHLTLSSQVPKSVNARTVELVKLITEVGPDVPEISRRLGQFKESVRYRYKEKILNKGFAVQASADHERLGLKRVMAILDFAEPYRMYAQSILASMNELCFLVSFAKTMPAGYYVAQFSAPDEYVSDLRNFLQALKDRGIFTRLEMTDYQWVRTAPMKAEYYDFDTGRWDFDWSEKSSEDFGAVRYSPSARAKYDYVDLLIIKELQMDANRSLKEISDRIKVNYKKLAWHYTTHVHGRRLIRGYSVNWMGTRYDSGIERVLHRQHRYIGVLLSVRGAGDYEAISLRQELDKLPFLWAEFVGKDYAAFLTFPVDSVVDGLQYLTSKVETVKEKAQTYIVDQTDAASFTIPYPRFDPSQKRWTFNSAELLGRFDILMMEIKNGSG